MRDVPVEKSREIKNEEIITVKNKNLDNKPKR